LKINNKIKLTIVVLLATSFLFFIFFKTSYDLNSLDKKDHTSSIQIQKAKHFTTYDNGKDTVLIDGAERKLILSNKSGDQNKENNVVIPTKRLVVFSSTHAAYLNRLGIADRIVGITGGNTQEWFIKPIKDGLENNTIKDLGVADNPDYDQLVALNPDLVVLVGGTGLWEKHAKKLDELGIPYVVSSEWLEDDPLGRFEWIKFFGVLTGTESIADTVFEETIESTESLFDSVKQNKSPKVVWAGIFNGIVYVPRNSSYVGQILKDANSDYVFSDINGSGSAEISIEELVFRARNADVFVFSGGFVNSTDEITSIHPLLAKLSPIQKCNVYSFQPWYWQSADRYDEYAHDVVAMIHQNDFEHYQLKQFKKVECA
jgi:iron complex transport system substrate-binding protein